jgi:hypothetical protein
VTPPRARRRLALGLVALLAVVAAIVTGTLANSGPTGFLVGLGPTDQSPTPSESSVAPRTASPRAPSPGHTASPQPSVGLSPAPSLLGAAERGYLVTADELRDRVRRAEAGQAPFDDALDELLAFAQSRVEDDPRPMRVLDIPGTEGPFVDDTTIAYGLALAAVATGEQRYAEVSREFIMAWVRTTEETANTCPDGGGCQTSLVIGRVAPAFIFAADLLHAVDAFPDADDAAFRTWLRDVILPAASERPNNWGDTGAFLRVVVGDYLDDDEAFEDGLDLWFDLFDLVETDGHIPPEVERGHSGLGYTQEALQYKIATAVVAGRRGIDLWTHENDNGVTLKDAIDYLAGYWDRRDEWPWHHRPQRRVAPGPAWEIAYARWQDADYIPIIEERRPYGPRGHSAIRWTTLTNGIPFPGD